MNITFINSKGHWNHGWFTSPTDLEKALSTLKKAGLELQCIEVENLHQLETALDRIPADTLIWPNAYFVNDDNGMPVWLNERLEARNLPIVGSSAETLQRVLRKDECQTILAGHRLPIPAFAIINRENVSEIESIIGKSNLEFPVVLKPTAESGSVGVIMAKDRQESISMARQILAGFPLSNVIMEEFMPSDDITCGFVQLGDRVLLLPTAYIVKSVSGKTNILSRKERLRSWDDHDKMQPHITDDKILEQLKTHILPIVEALDVKGITRIDGRLDKYGKLRFFDINGLPALCFPDSVMVKQCFTCFPDFGPVEIFDGLIHTIVHHALLHYGMDIPGALQEHNLFTMKSELAIKTNFAKNIAT